LLSDFVFDAHSSLENLGANEMAAVGSWSTHVVSLGSVEEQRKTDSPEDCTD